MAKIALITVLILISMITTKLNTRAGVKSAFSAKLNIVLKGFLKVYY